MTKQEAMARISALLQQYVAAQDPAEFDLLPKALTAGKLYEAYALALVSRDLAHSEGLTLRLVNGNYLPLKSSPGPINRSYPHVQLRRYGHVVAEMWTDIEFLSLSYTRGFHASPTKGDYHELDIAVVEPGLEGRPRNDQIWLGVECKNTGYTKGLLKEILGVRRELSYLQDNHPTKFHTWPCVTLPCQPASCLLVFSSDPKVVAYARPGTSFGIEFRYEELAL